MVRDEAEALETICARLENEVVGRMVAKMERFCFLYLFTERKEGGRTVMWEINNSMSPLQYLLRYRSIDLLTGDNKNMMNEMRYGTMEGYWNAIECDAVPKLKEAEPVAKRRTKPTEDGIGDGKTSFVRAFFTC